MKTFDLTGLAGRHVLLVAPHPDDEVIGCGGTVHLLAQAGAHVIVVITARGDGGIGGDGAVPADREAESQAACSILGTQPPIFLRIPSQRLREDPAAAARELTSRVGRGVHDLLLVPSPLERHPTHRAALVAALLSGAARPDAAWWGYGAWDAIPATADSVEIDTTEARSVRTRALAAHVSQTSCRSLTAGIAGRELDQATFSRLVGSESRRSVERLLDLSGLAPLPEDARTVDGARARTVDWLVERSAAWVAERWGPDAE